MLETVLSHFPPHTHALTVVSDPDGVLADEEILTGLDTRGFTLIQERDPVLLRYRVERARPWSIDHPLIVVTGEPLNTLPYDLWQQGHHVTLALHSFFPKLSYPELRGLTPAQRARLTQAPKPTRRLGRRTTRAYLLHHVFDADPETLKRPASLLAWLDAYHHHPNLMPAALLEDLISSLNERAVYADWPIRELLVDSEFFSDFVQDVWTRYVRDYSGDRTQESAAPYLDFGADTALQNVIGHLVRSGSLAPVTVPSGRSFPEWARPTLLTDPSKQETRQLSLSLARAQSMLENLPESPRWPDWHSLMRAWAELTLVFYQSDPSPSEENQQVHRHLQSRLDRRFSDWLQARYAPLAARALPEPHHLYHIPGYLADRYPIDEGHRIALIVLDGLALADWFLIKRTWQSHHPDWAWEEHLVLAQVPTLTAISRQALISGRRPAHFADALTTTYQEPSRWSTFWAGRGLEPRAAPYVRLRQHDAHLPPEFTSVHSRAVCVVDTAVDTLGHNAALGNRDFYRSLHLWLNEASGYLDHVLTTLREQDFVLALTSDHGHTQALGMGRPSQGILAETRGQRARLYEDRTAAEMANQQFPETHLWSSKGILPDEVFALIPKGRRAFTTANTSIIAHGGITADEIVVPFVIMTPHR